MKRYALLKPSPLPSVSYLSDTPVSEGSVCSSLALIGFLYLIAPYLVTLYLVTLYLVTLYLVALYLVALYLVALCLIDRCIVTFTPYMQLSAA